MVSNRSNKQGFTIIEVVLVLAIAGLIFAVVFIGLPALRRSQRDMQRKNDVAIIAAAIRQYQKNNHGKAPPDSGKDDSTEHQYDDDDEERSGIIWSSGNDSVALRRYLIDLSPSGVTTKVTVVNFADGNPSAGNRYTIGDEDIDGYVTVFVGATCPDMTTSGTTVTIPQTNKRSDIIILRYLEGGHWYCLTV